MTFFWENPVRALNAKPRWTIFVGDEKGVHSPVHFSTRLEAEQFAARRSVFRRGIIQVHKFGSNKWTTIYRNGWMIDTQDGRSYKPPEQLAEEQELRERFRPRRGRS